MPAIEIMLAGMKICSDTRQSSSDCLPESLTKPVRRRSHKATRPQLLTRSELDGRTNAAKLFDKLVVDIENDLGGHNELSTIERALVEGFAGAALTLHDLNTRLALGQEIDLSQHAQAVSAMVRVASRLGISRRAKEVTTPTLDEIAAEIEAEKAATSSEEITS